MKDIDTLFINAVHSMLMRTAEFEVDARAFIYDETGHPYADYIRLMLYWSLAESGRAEDARKLIQERMGAIDRSTWSARLDQGDSMVWREMLVAFFAGELSAEAIFGPLRDDLSFRTSGLWRTELALAGMRCEAYFYTALRERVQHPMGEALQFAYDRVLELNANQTRVTYKVQTRSGSSGSPCFDADWNLVAIHHGGDPRTGRPLGEFNQGIPIAAIRSALPSGLVARLRWSGAPRS